MNNNNSYDFILDYLKLDNILVNRSDSLLNKMEKHFGELREQSSDFVTELIFVLENNPQTIINLNTSFLHNRESLSKLIETSYSEKKRMGKKGKSLPDKLKSIADVYELSGVFTLAAVLLNKGNFKTSNLKNSKSVLSHLKSLGLNSNDIQNIRLIRNASSHKYTFENKKIVWKKNSISFKIIEDLSKKLDNILSWYFTIIIYSLIFIPKFGILTVLCIITEMDNKTEEWKEYVGSINFFYNEILTEMRITQENTEKDVKKNHKTRIRDSNAEIFLMEKFSIIFERLSWHLNSIADIFGQLTKSIDLMEEKKLADKLEKWFRKQASFCSETLKEIKKNPDEFSKYFSKRIGINNH